ncbi:hypothetical protein [Azospirillum rugosum]|uniref:ABC transmembrane type-1 domain-containing protein n=1 Tax=Azospirillum rugosum TaxID=416170 RepID=A0ABS4SH00_9PROT|nr:hypothetical protein [Azospirillum rugosum]MBP2291849.1 hypothetical protein [Azospirillum rugosum]MDQ0524339.1 hypothetical protein [Azospirillum rugosum]
MEYCIRWRGSLSIVLFSLGFYVCSFGIAGATTAEIIAAPYLEYRAQETINTQSLVQIGARIVYGFAALSTLFVLLYVTSRGRFVAEILKGTEWGERFLKVLREQVLTTAAFKTLLLYLMIGSLAGEIAVRVYYYIVAACE